MAVRDALLALLTAGPAYGFQLHGGLAARTGGRRLVNVGQTYATLERLTKQGLIESAGSTSDGLPLHRLTIAGEAAAIAWLGGADAAGGDPWDETLDRVLVAWSLPGCDAAAVVSAERERWARRRSEASAAATASGPPQGDEANDDDGSAVRHAEAALARLAASAELDRTEAALAWLDSLDGMPRLPFAPSSDRPRRGRRPSASVDDAGDGSAPAESEAQPADA
jgi:DNA-binding PadR family transcriptional regulator